jgi:hypothetical protein
VILASRLGGFNERGKRRLHHPQEAPDGLDAGRDAGEEVRGVEQAARLPGGGIGATRLQVTAHEVLVAVVPRRFARPQEPAGQRDVPRGEAEIVRGDGVRGGGGGECYQPAIQQGQIRALTRAEIGPEEPGDGPRQLVRGPSWSALIREYGFPDPGT